MHEGLDLYERSTCRYIRLNALNVPHIPQPRFITIVINFYKASEQLAYSLVSTILKVMT